MSNSQNGPVEHKDDCQLLEELLEEVRRVKSHLQEIMAGVDELGSKIENVLDVIRQ